MSDGQAVNPIAEKQDEDIYTKSGAYRGGVLFLLLIVYTLNFLDRQVLVILSKKIVEEFNLSTLELAALMGIYFALFYSLLGIPIAYLADRASRSWIITISLFVWSAMTALCGLAQNYAQLAAARFGVGVGEAGCTPPAQSMIADIFPAKSRATALSIYALGIPIGSGIGILLGGYLVEPVGWRWTFILVGMPGVFLAVLFRLLVREPKRGRFATAEERAMNKAGFGETFSLLACKPTFWLVALGCGFAGMAGYTMTGLSALYIGLTYGVPEARIGEMMLVTSVFVAIGTFLGGWLADRMAPKWGTETYGLVAGIGYFISIPFFLWAFEAKDPWMFILIGLFPAVLHYMYLGPGWSMIQAVAPVRMRAMAVAILFLFPTILGLAIGVTFFGGLADYFSAQLFTSHANEAGIAQGMSYANNCVGDVKPTGQLSEFCNDMRQKGMRNGLPLLVIVFILSGIFFVLSAFTFGKDRIEERA